MTGAQKVTVKSFKLMNNPEVPMKRLFVFITLIFNFTVMANDVVYENVYDRYFALAESPRDFNQMLSQEFYYYLRGDKDLSMPKRYEAMMDALWDKAYMAEGIEAEKAREILMTYDFSELDDFTLLRSLILASNLELPRLNIVDKEVVDRFRFRLEEDAIEFGTTILVHRKELMDLGLSALVERAKKLYQIEWQNIVDSKGFKHVSKDLIQDLVFNAPELDHFEGGKYEKGIRLYMFCRHNRKFPCLMIMKDHNNQLVYDSNGELWHQAKLGLSKRGIPSSKKNGHTPAGVLTIDSVMPEANKKYIFGKHRRLILNFIRKTKNEEKIKSVLPPSSHESNWWKQALVARDAGRTLLRIHGTGMKNNDSRSTFWPFVATSGCVASREGSYGSRNFVDQRYLLDQMMLSMGLPKKYANERKLKGLLHVIEVDNQNKAFTLEDLKKLL